MYNAETDIDRSKLVEIRGDETPDEIIHKCVRNTLVVLGDNPDREGLKGTPDRICRMYKEIYEGMNYTNEEIAGMFNTCFEDVETGDLVVIGDIPVFSMCEHHMALMYNMNVSIGYIPNGKVIGLSKAARIADMVSRRLQLQERIGSDIAEILQMVLDTEDVIVVITGEHSCMTARGIKKPGSKTRTASIRGRFDSDHQLRQEFYSLISNR